ncbi:DsbA family protein [Staphylococcus schleiferi]|uniref:DsbA family protein n=1 Tax=Staphylococcus schleiferi TaxID=1295 RepID=UPI002480325B|nr:thioredoxin domain-containing protein [Staphylococcus schleiferi]
MSPKQLEKITSAYRDKNGEIAKKARNDNNLAKKYKVPQVPSLYINGEPIEDTTDFDTIKSKIDQVIKDQKS